MTEEIYYYRIHQQKSLFFRMICFGSKPPSNFIRINDQYYKPIPLWTRDFGHYDIFETKEGDPETLYRRNYYAILRWNKFKTEIAEVERTVADGRYRYEKSQLRRKALAWKYIRNIQ